MYLHGGNIREASKKYHIPLDKIIDFSANINPLGAPVDLRKIVEKNINSILHYPDPEYGELKKELASYLGIRTNNILVGNGAVDLIFLILRALQVKQVLIPIPTFVEYERAVKSIGGKSIFLKLKEKNEFKIEVKEILKYLPMVDLVFICNPNNPTGTLLSKREILFLARESKRYGVVLIIDESFVDFVEKTEEVTVIKEAIQRLSNIFVIRSFTKFFAIPGLRVGYVVSSVKYIESILSQQPPWSVNCFGASVAREAIKNSYYIKQSKKYIYQEREKLFRELLKIKGIKPFPSSANFILCKLTKRQLSLEIICDILGKKGLLIRRCSNFLGLGDEFFRIAVRKKEENEILVNALKEVIEK
jgi:threonine-phosphate decarboxylase